MASPMPLKIDKSTRPDVASRRQQEPTAFDILSVVRRRIFLILGVAAITVSLAIVYLVGLSPRYVAYSQILLGEQGLSSRGTFDLLEAQAVTNSVIEGELAVLRSGALLVRIADRLDLANTAEFNADLRPPERSIWIVDQAKSAVTTLKDTIFPVDDDLPLALSENQSSTIADAAAAGDPKLRENDAIVNELRQKIDVRQLGSSFVVQVVVDSENPLMAAAVANTLMEEYIGFLTDKRFLAAQRFTNWLETRVEELAVKLEEYEQDALAFRSIMEADANSGERLEQQMSELTSKMVDARAELAFATAQARRTAAIWERDGPLAAADILSSDEIVRYRNELGDRRREAANAAINFGEDSLQRVSIERAIEKIEESIAIEVNRAVKELRNRAEVSETVVESLETALADMENLVLARSADNIRLNQLQRIADANNRVYQEFLGRFKETSEIQNLQSPDAEVISYASPPTSAAYPRKKVGAVLAAVGGLFAGLTIAFLLELLPQRIKTFNQLATITGLSIYGSVPRRVHKMQAAQLLATLAATPTGAIAKSAKRILKTADLRAGDFARSIVVTGSSSGAAKSGVALMLGWAANQKGRSSIVVDVDIRDAHLSQSLKLVNRQDQTTFIDVLYENTPFEPAMRLVEPSGMHMVACAPSGSDPALIFNTDRAQSIITHLLATYDTVIFDAPALTQPSDILTLPMCIDVGLFVAVAGKTRVSVAQTGVELLSQTDFSSTGTVLTNLSNFKP